MTATYAFDVFNSLDGFGAAGGNWTGYWGKQGPELLARRLALYSENQQMIFGANTYRLFAKMLASSTQESGARPTRTRQQGDDASSSRGDGPATAHYTLVDDGRRGT